LKANRVRAAVSPYIFPFNNGLHARE